MFWSDGAAWLDELDAGLAPRRFVLDRVFLRFLFLSPLGEAKGSGGPRGCTSEVSFT